MIRKRAGGWWGIFQRGAVELGERLRRRTGSPLKACWWSPGHRPRRRREEPRRRQEEVVAAAGVLDELDVDDSDFEESDLSDEPFFDDEVEADDEDDRLSVR